MCGIIGYIGEDDVVSRLISGLARLEYRGYDSAGIAYFSDGRLQIFRAAGRLSALTETLSPRANGKGAGIGHTRWATHGKPTADNAHPHRYGPLAIIHNGIFENYLSLKDKLVAQGHTFTSDTDTEVLVHWIGRHYKNGTPLTDAVREAMTAVEGSFAFCLLSEREPDQVVALRSGCPLVIGQSDQALFVASDIPAFLAHTRHVIYLEDGEMAILSRGDLQVQDRMGQRVTKKVETIHWDAAMAEKDGYPHFMLKEIHEQSRALMDTMCGRVAPETGQVMLEGISADLCASYQACKRLVLIGCGTSWHAALVGKFLMERLAGIPTEVDVASEFRYRDPQLLSNDMVVAISQSGETADTLAAVREARSRIIPTLAICNVVGSSISREADAVFYTHAGPEISVASTKAFTTQLMSLTLLAIYLGRLHHRLSETEARRLIHSLVELPAHIDALLSRAQEIQEIAQEHYQCRDFLYLGRGMQYPVALEGALKLKEISYIHAEGYPAGEMKHGPIALIDCNMPVVILAPKDQVYDKMFSNASEVKARGGRLIAFVEEGDQEISRIADTCFRVPKMVPCLNPILMTVPLQLLAYDIAVLRGNDVDNPRNLAKSVTVE